MTRKELEKYLGKKVEIKLFDNEIITGFLKKTGDEAFRNNPNLYLPQNRYLLTNTINSTLCTSCLFRVSHIRTLKQIN